MDVQQRFRFAAILLFAGISEASASVSFTDTYLGWDGAACAQSYAIVGEEPQAAGRYPVYIHTVGTFEAYNSADAMEFVHAMADRGFVSATVDYSNGAGACPEFANRARCIYDETGAQSAVARLCARAKADCSRGIFVSGLSQGAVIAIVANNYDSRVKAAYALSAGSSTCTMPSGRTLPSERLRVVDGEADGFFGGNAAGVRSELEGVTGRSCGTAARSCLSSDGSGWYMVQSADVADGTADHCYYFVGGCGGGSFDAGWLPPASASWSLNSNLDWLAAFVQTTPPPNAAVTVEQLLIYPNPWRFERNANTSITIDRLRPESTVRIFTIAGRVVRKLPVSSAGKAIWDVKNDKGQSVASGIYLITGMDRRNERIRGKATVIR